MANRIEPGIVHDVLRVEKPASILQLVNGIHGRTNATQREIVSLLDAMVKSGELKIKRSTCMWLPSWFRNFLEAHPFLQSLLLHYKTEAILKAISIIIFCNVMSWFIILAFQTSEILTPVRILFHGINLLFLPGFAITISWYPFPSTRLDFSKLDRRVGARDGQKQVDTSRSKELDFLTRTAYAICYSIGLVILAGFLIGLLGLGFNITILLCLFTIIEIMVIVDLIVKIQRLRDPYLHI